MSNIMLGIDLELIPAIEKTYNGTQAVFAEVSALKLPGMKAIREAASNAAIDAAKAKKTFDARLRPFIQDDMEHPGHQLLVIDSKDKVDALALVRRYLSLAAESSKEVEQLVLSREMSQEPRLYAPDDNRTSDDHRENMCQAINESIKATPGQKRRDEKIRKEADEERAELADVQAELPEHTIIMTTHASAFLGRVADAIASMQNAIDKGIQQPGTNLRHR